MGSPGARLVHGAVQELLGHRLSGEHLVTGIDPGVDHTGGLAASRRGAEPVPQFEVRPGPLRPDTAQPPLVLEIIRPAVYLRNIFAFLFV